MEKLNKFLHEFVPYSSTLGLELQEFGDGIAVFEMNYRNPFKTHLTRDGCVTGRWCLEYWNGGRLGL